MERRARPILVTNPASDRAFSMIAESIAAEDGMDVRRFIERLRRIYPLARAHPRLLSGERLTIWYVYRDGLWVDEHGPPAAGGAG